jgi:hypothetical protein
LSKNWPFTKPSEIGITREKKGPKTIRGTRIEFATNSVATAAGPALVREDVSAATSPATDQLPGSVPGAVSESVIKEACFPEGFLWGAATASYRQVLAELARAIADGARVRAYHAWSLLDNFQWAEGYTERYGLIHTDFRSQKRTIKDSGFWYSRVAASNRLDV